MIRTSPVDLRQAARRLSAQYARATQLTPRQLALFSELSAPYRFRHFLLTGAGSIVLFNLFLISDRFMVPDVFGLAVAVRLYLLTPLVLLMVVAGLILRDWWLQHVRPWMTECVAMAGTMAVAASLGVIMLNTDSAQLSFYRCGLIPVLVFGNLVQRLRFPYALTSSMFILGVYAVSVLAAHGKALPYALIDLPLGMLLALVMVYTLVSNFNLEIDERQRFLQAQRGIRLRAQLERTHDELRQVSRLDSLTGLANRRQFDADLADCAVRGCALGLIVIDVDHFKAFNDRYGHPAGDRCLQVVAGALQRALPPGRSKLVRWGGEEFALLLPEMDQAGCMAIAEHMRRCVQDESMRHEASATASVVTVSCGVTWLPAAPPPRSLDALLAAADQALYQAKRAGRNRCAYSSSNSQMS